MADNLLLKLINSEIDLKSFKDWILLNSQEGYQLIEQNCSQTDFLTYFLNFIHEEIIQVNKIADTVQKCNTIQHKNADNIEGLTKITENSNLIKSINSLPHFDKSLENRFTPPIDSDNISTPKVFRIQSETSFNSSYYSPISPLYRASNYVTPKNRKVYMSQNSTEKASPLRLNDFIIKKNSAKKSSKCDNSFNENPRRITPTCLGYEQPNGVRKTVNSFSNFNMNEESSKNVNESRSYIIEGRLKVLTKNNSSENFATLSKKLNYLTNQRREIRAEVSSITYQDKLNKLSEIYTIILQNYLALDVNSEIHFLISLLLNKHFMTAEEHFNSSDDLDNDFKYLDEPCTFKDIQDNMKNCSFLFESLHNIIYFVIKSLELLLNILKYYDKSTLMLLSENERIKDYSVGLSLNLKKISEEKSDRLTDMLDEGDQSNICFNLDTDNRDNFPNDISFHSFRKQRDLFYDILRIWENNHSSPGWDFSIGLSGKVRSLLSLQTEPANFVHFCRLFKDQLLGSCGKSLKEDAISEEDISFLNSLPNVDTNKLNRLKNRLITKQPSVSLNSLPLFTGYQEFYKDFIIVAANYTFNRHLCDILITEIVELNDTKFCNDFVESEEADSSIDSEVIKSFVICLRHLRVLAKFLGFVESLPYKSDCNYNCSENVVSMQIKIRQESTPTFDIKQLLINSIQQNTLILSIPWICKYLSMLDFVTLRLPYYNCVLKILIRLYRTRKNPLQNYDYNDSLIKFSLGWLFELPHFPDSEFFNFSMTESNSVECSKKFPKSTLDSSNIVDQNILYLFCPYLEKIKKLLMTTSLNNTVTIKHITPVTAIYSSEKITKKRIEQQLEQSFFNNQPSSMKKTIEFVTERIASSCVKHICYSIVPEYKKRVFKEIRDYLRAHKEIMSATENSSHTILKHKMNRIAHMHTLSLKELCEKETSKILEDKIELSIESLLAIDTLPQTKTTCVSITVKMSKERVKQWITTHINTSIFLKEFDIERSKFLNEEKNKNITSKPLVALPSLGNGKNHNDNLLSAAHLLENCQNLAIEILEKPVYVNKKIILKTLNDAYLTLNERCDVNESINSYICMLLVDITLLLVIYCPEVIFCEEFKKQFIESLKMYYGNKEHLFKNLFCSRNIIMMAQPCQDKKIWDNLAKLVAFLIKENILSCSNLESQCTRFYQREWDQDTLKNMSHFLSRFISYYKQDGGDTQHFTLLLQFLSEFCTDL